MQLASDSSRIPIRVALATESPGVCLELTGHLPLTGSSLRLNANMKLGLDVSIAEHGRS